MEEIIAMKPVSGNYSYEIARKQCGLVAFVVLCIRGYFGWLGDDTIIFTLFLNLLLIISIDYKHVSKLFLIVPFLVISMLNNKTVLGIIDLITMCLILKSVEINKLARIYLITLILFIPIWLFLLKEGFIVSNRWFDPAKGGESWDYGFINPNGLGILGFHLCATLYLVLYKKHLLLSIFLSLFISQLFYSISLCRTAWIGGIILAFCSILLYLKLYKKWMIFPLAIFPILLFLVTIFLSKRVSNYEFLDILLSGRLSIWHNIMNSMGFLNWLFGASQGDLTIDGSFAMILFLGGMILVSIFCFLFYKLITNYYSKIIPYLPFMLSIMACGVMETTFSSCGGLSVIFWYFLLNQNKFANTKHLITTK